jgi:zinc/manganese transport system substrate-binding protein
MSRSSARRVAVAVALTAVALGVSSCGSDGGGSAVSGAVAEPSATGAVISVVASTNVYGDIVRQVAGDRVKITSIIADPEQDPHSYEADATTQLELSKASVVIENGGGYDDFVDTMLSSAHNTSADVINVVNLSGKRAPAGGELNEHVWYDFPTVTTFATAVARTLGSVDPANADRYRANAEMFNHGVANVEKQEAAIKSAHDGAGVAITEPVPLYLLEACGLINKTPAEFSQAIEEGTGVSAGVLNQTLQLFKNGSVKVLVYNQQTAGPETEKVLKEAKADGVPVVPVTETLPPGKDFLTWMSDNLRALDAALS